MRQISDYKILGSIAKGQFGRVFAGVDRASGALVALKELKLEQPPSSNLWRELYFLSTLNQVNLVGYRILKRDGDSYYIVMDYCEGGTLRNLIGNSALDICQSLQLVIDILSALELAHSKGVIHLHLQPENILLKLSDRSYTPLIANFGIAKLYKNCSFTYMAPEQFYGKCLPSCDLYAVGIILFELIVGKPPFSGTPQELSSAHLELPVTIPKSVPVLLRSAISKALQKLPHRRFQNAQQMRESLQSIQTILKTTGSPISPSTPTFTTLTPISTEILEQSVTHLAIASEQIYLASQNQLILYSDRGSNSTESVERWQFALDLDIRSIQLGSYGCFVQTSSSIYCLPYDTDTQEFRFFSQTSLPIATFPTDNLVSAIDPQGYWFAASYLPNKSKTAAWSIFKLPNCQLLRSQINRKPWNFLVALNRRYGLGIYQNQQHNTEFHLFDRRSNWLANFTVMFQLKTVTYNPLFPDRLLATEVENSQMAILITLKPFSIKRIVLQIAPTFITSSPQGYLLGDRQGKFVAIDALDLKVSYLQIPLPAGFTVTAVATSKTKLLVASASASQARLQEFFPISCLV